ncbi:uncharacterized protein LOC117296695 [Asterias rubens]|uniref:uncharacterized protein LOC117296695 n=1 Tax=Asterias rubens TaxID=7604 RepID=UPI001455B0F2|nr:uncharacterized protein LOC117296695 [Asterias rubens]
MAEQEVDHGRYTDFDYIPLKAAKDSKRKVTRKRTQLEMKIGENYPAEGHCSITCSSPEENCYRVLSFGGARRKEERTWQDGAAITEFIISADDEDVSISSITTCRTKGGSLPPLHGAAIIDLDTKLIMWGGLDLNEYRCRDDLLVITEQHQRRGSALFQITYVETLCRKTPSRQGHDLPHQSGPVPSAFFGLFLFTGRTGHTLTRIGETDKALLFGGICMGQRNKGFGSRFCKSCKDGRFYVLNTETFEWQHVKVPLITSRAYHTTTCISKDSEYVIGLIGGVVFDGNLPSHREALSEVAILTMDKQFNNCTLQELSLAPTVQNTREVFLSSHATVVHNSSIIVVGGIQTTTKEVQNKAPKALATAYRIDLPGKQYEILPKTTSAPILFSTYGHSVHNLKPDNTILVLGGSSRQISLLTDRSFEPEPCDFIPCTIISSLHLNDTTWIQCDKCKKWYHTHCINLDKVPDGQFFCFSCKK